MTKTHLEQTFAEAERCHPDLMESYSGRLADARTSDERITIMAMGLRETFKRRYPMPEGCGWPDGSRGDGTIFRPEESASS